MEVARNGGSGAPSAPAPGRASLHSSSAVGIFLSDTFLRAGWFDKCSKGNRIHFKIKVIGFPSATQDGQGSSDQTAV